MYKYIYVHWKYIFRFVASDTRSIELTYNFPYMCIYCTSRVYTAMHVIEYLECRFLLNIGYNYIKIMTLLYYYYDIIIINIMIIIIIIIIYICY